DCGRGSVRKLVPERAGERQADESADGAREPRHLKRRDAREQWFLRDHAAGVEKCCGEAEERAPARREPVLRGRAADNDRARERDGAADEQAAWKALAQDD